MSLFTKFGIYSTLQRIFTLSDESILIANTDYNDKGHSVLIYEDGKGIIVNLIDSTNIVYGYLFTYDKTGILSVGSQQTVFNPGSSIGSTHIDLCGDSADRIIMAVNGAQQRVAIVLLSVSGTTITIEDTSQEGGARAEDGLTIVDMDGDIVLTQEVAPSSTSHFVHTTAADTLTLKDTGEFGLAGHDIEPEITPSGNKLARVSDTIALATSGDGSIYAVMIDMSDPVNVTNGDTKTLATGGLSSYPECPRVFDRGNGKGFVSWNLSGELQISTFTYDVSTLVITVGTTYEMTTLGNEGSLTEPACQPIGNDEYLMIASESSNDWWGYYTKLTFANDVPSFTDFANYQPADCTYGRLTPPDSNGLGIISYLFDGASGGLRCKVYANAGKIE